MKTYLLSFFFLATFSASQSQTTAPGYYITKNNDTVVAEIKIPRSLFGVDLSKLLLKVETVDSIDGTKKFKPKDINGFGFLYEGNYYRYFSKPTITQNNFRFLQPFVLGPKTSIYVFYTADQNGRPLGSVYTLEKADGTYAFLSTPTLNLNKVKETIKEFYKDYPEVQQLIDARFKTKVAIKNDIVEIVRAVNKS